MCWCLFRRFAVAGTKESSSVTQVSRKLLLLWMWLWGGNIQGLREVGGKARRWGLAILGIGDDLSENPYWLKNMATNIPNLIEGNFYNPLNYGQAKFT